MIDLIIIYVVLIVLILAVSVVLQRMWRKIAQIEISVVRQVMEESPELADKILKTQHQLYDQGGIRDGSEALRAARRLYGLEP